MMTQVWINTRSRQMEIQNISLDLSFMLFENHSRIIKWFFIFKRLKFYRHISWCKVHPFQMKVNLPWYKITTIQRYLNRLELRCFKKKKTKKKNHTNLPLSNIINIFTEMKFRKLSVLAESLLHFTLYAFEWVPTQQSHELIFK